MGMRQTDQTSPSSTIDGGEHHDAEDFFQADLFIDKNYTAEEVNINGVVVQLEALHNSASTDFDLTGQIIWPASRLLALYLTTRGLQDTSYQRVLEVGAGVGLAGLVAAQVMASAKLDSISADQEVILTDNQEEVLKVLERNVELNFKDTDIMVKTKCAHLAWGDRVEEFSQEYGKFDLIIGADVVFWPSAVPLLFDTAAILLSPKEESRLVISYISRSDFSTKLMYECARKSGFVWDDLDLTTESIYLSLIEEQKACGRSAHLLIFTRKHTKCS